MEEVSDKLWQPTVPCKVDDIIAEENILESTDQLISKKRKHDMSNSGSNFGGENSPPNQEHIKTEVRWYSIYLHAGVQINISCFNENIVNI